MRKGTKVLCSMAMIPILSSNTCAIASSTTQSTEYIMNNTHEINEILYISKQRQYENIMAAAEQKRIEDELKAQEEARLLEEQKRREQEIHRINNVKFNSYDISEISNITYEELYNVLSESHYSNMLEFYTAYVDAEQTYGVNAFALIAISGLESGWNRSSRARNGRNNIVGMAVYDDNSYGTVYNSKYDCIMDLARQLKTYYLTVGAKYYNGLSTSKVNISYSASKDWYKQVDAIGDELVAIYNRLYR